jgi:hypothetical protein
LAINDSTGTTMKKFIEEERIDYVLYCDSMAKADKSGIIKFDEEDKRFSKIFINDKATIIKIERLKTKE